MSEKKLKYLKDAPFDFKGQGSKFFEEKNTHF